MIQMAIASALAAGVVMTWLPAQVGFLTRSNQDIVCAFKTGKTCVFDGIDAHRSGLERLVVSVRVPASN